MPQGGPPPQYPPYGQAPWPPHGPPPGAPHNMPPQHHPGFAPPRFMNGPPPPGYPHPPGMVPHIPFGAQGPPGGPPHQMHGPPGPLAQRPPMAGSPHLPSGSGPLTPTGIPSSQMNHGLRQTSHITSSPDATTLATTVTAAVPNSTTPATTTSVAATSASTASPSAPLTGATAPTDTTVSKTPVSNAASKKESVLVYSNNDVSVVSALDRANIVIGSRTRNLIEYASLTSMISSNHRRKSELLWSDTGSSKRWSLHHKYRFLAPFCFEHRHWDQL